MKTSFLKAALCLFLAAGASTLAQAQITFTSTTNQPGVGPYDQYYLPAAVVEGTDTIGSPFTASGNNDASTYVSSTDRSSKAQSFTTGPAPQGYTLNSFTFQQAFSGTNTWLDNGTFFLINDGDSWDVRFGTISGASYTSVLETPATYSGTTYNQGGTAAALGVFFTFDLTGAGITLAPNTTYFFELAANNGSDHFEMNNTSTNPTSRIFPALYKKGTALIGNTVNDLDRTGTFGTNANGGEFAFVASMSAVGAPTVSLLVSPTNGQRGQTFTVTATSTNAPSATVTNATVNLSAIGGSATAPLVLSSVNIFTNTFTVPAAAPLGVATLTATVTDTQGLLGSGNTTYTVVPRPPTNAYVATQISGTTNVYAYTEASFNFVATNDAAPPGVFPMNYAWYKNGVLVSTNAMGSNYTFLTTPADNNSTITCIASVADTNYSTVSVTSGTLILTTQPGALVYTNGLKDEFFQGAVRTDVENNSNPHGKPITLIPSADSSGSKGNNYAERYSGYFIPPTNGTYVFFVASDDDSDVYLSTDSNPANKRLICQESGYSAVDNWITPGGNGSLASQKRSDQWSPDGGATTPYAAGFPLIGGQLYYFESVHHQATGGDNWAVTFQTTTSLTDPNNVFVDGTPSLMTAANTNIATVTWPGTNIVWTQQLASKSVFEGDTATFTAPATSDAEMVPNYTWYLNGVAIPGAGGPNGTNLSLPLVTLANNGAQISVVASTEAMSITNGPVTLTVLRAVFESGFAKEEKWLGLTSRTPIENGTAGNPTFSVAMPGFEQGADSPGGQGDFGLRMTGFFIPPTSGDYVFFISSDDDSDLFVSTDDTAANKRLIAQEAGWSGTFSWLTPGGGGSTASQKRSDQWLPTGVTTAPYQNGITLNAGQKYYMEVDHHNGAAGGTHVGVKFKLTSDGDPANGTVPNATGNTIGINAIRSNVGFTQQPANASSVVGGYVTFSALGTTDSLLPVSASFTGNESRFTNNYVLYQWYKNGVAISNATATSVTVGPLEASDAGAVITCQIRSLGFADASFNPIWSNSTPATITFTSTQSVFEPGYVRHDVWTNQTSRATIEGGGQGGSPYLTYATPAFEGPVGSTGPVNYGQRISGYFVPPADGNYAFVINTDDDSDLFVSTDSTRANERLVAQEGVWSNPFQWNTAGSGTASLKNSASWSPDGGNTVPYSAGFPMVHGQKYYIEVVHHNGSGNNNAELTYYNVNTELVPANGSDTRLTNNVIGMYAPRVAAMAFTLQPVSQHVASGGNSVTFSASGNSGSPSIQIGTTGDFQSMFTNPAPSVIYQWYKNGVAIPGATSSKYTQIPVLPSDNNAQFVCGIRVLGYSDNSLNPVFSNSVPAVLTVTADTVPPLLSYAATLVNSNQDPVEIIVDVTFNEWMDSTTANNKFNYTVAGATVTQATLASNHRTVELVLNQMPTLPLNITVNNVQDVSGNPIAANSTTPINPVQLTFQDIGNPGNSSSFGVGGIDPAYPSSIWVEGTNGFLVSAEGSDIFGVADGFNFGWQLMTNDFDVVVRVVSNGHTSNYAKAGLMVREDLTASSRNWNVINDPAAADGIQAPDNSGFGANNIECNMRATNGVGSISWKTNTSITVPTYPNAWVRIKRVGNVLTGYSSTNSVDWVALGAYDTSTNAYGPLPSAVYVGICTTAHNNDSASATPPPPPFKYYNTAEYADYNSSFVATVRARLALSLSGANTIISWTPAGGHLESSPALSGPGVNWQSLGTANPATNPITSGSQFMRVVTP